MSGGFFAKREPNQPFVFKLVSHFQRSQQDFCTRSLKLAGFDLLNDNAELRRWSQCRGSPVSGLSQSRVVDVVSRRGSVLALGILMRYVAKRH